MTDNDRLCVLLARLAVDAADMLNPEWGAAQGFPYKAELYPREFAEFAVNRFKPTGV